MPVHMYVHTHGFRDVPSHLVQYRQTLVLLYRGISLHQTSAQAPCCSTSTKTQDVVKHTSALSKYTVTMMGRQSYSQFDNTLCPFDFVDVLINVRSV